MRHNNLKKRIISGFSAAAIATSIAATTVPDITASAYETVDVSYVWNTSVNPYFSGAVVGTSKAVNYEGNAVSIPSGEQLCRFNISNCNYYGLCVEPGARISNGENMSETDTWDNSEENYLDSRGYWTNLRENYRTYYAMIGRVNYYGYPNASTSNAYWAATQLLDWEIVLGFRDCSSCEAFGKGLLEGKKPLYNYLTFSSSNYATRAEIVAAYNDIVKNVSQHTSVPDDVDYETIREAKQNPTLVKYDWTEMEYSAKLDIENKYLDASSWAYMNIIDSLKSLNADLTVSRKKESRKSTITLSSQKKTMESAEIIVSDKITKEVNHGLFKGKPEEHLFTKAGKQTVVMGYNVDPISRYLALELVNYPDSKIVKQYKDSKGNIIKGNELATLLDNTKFIYQLTANNKTYYVVATRDDTGEYTFDHFSDNRAEATTFSLKVMDDRGTFTVKDLPTTSTGKKYRVKETKTPENYKSKDTIVTLPSYNTQDASKNETIRTVIYDEEYSTSYDWGSLEFNKNLLDENGGSSTLDVAELSAIYGDMRFVLAYNDNGVIKYVRNSNSAITERAPMVLEGTTPISISDKTGLITYQPNDGHYYLISKLGEEYKDENGNNVTPFVLNNNAFTTDIQDAYTFKVNNAVVNGEPSEDFGKMFINTVGLNSEGKTGKWMFIEMRSNQSYGISDADSTTEREYTLNNLTSAFDSASASGYVNIAGILEMTDSTDSNNKWNAMGKHSFSIVEDYTDTGVSNDLTAYLDNERYHYQLSVHKIRGGNGGNVSPADNSGTPIQGVEIGLYNSNYELIETIVTSGAGWDSFSTNFRYGIKYYIKELSAPTGIKISDDYIEIEREQSTDTGTMTNSTMYYSLAGEDSNTITNYPFNLNLEINKYNSIGGYNIAGVGFKVITNQDIDAAYTVDITDEAYANRSYMQGDEIGYITTDENGMASIAGLPLMADAVDDGAEYYPFTYTVVEDIDTISSNFVKTAESFEVKVPVDASEDTEASVKYDMPLITVGQAVSNTPQTIDLTIHKDSEFGEAIEGAKFELYPTKDVEIGGVVVQKADEKVAEFTTDKDGNANTTYIETEYLMDENGNFELDENGEKIVYREYTRTYLVYADQKYRLKEVSVPKPYTLSEDTIVTTDTEDKTIAVTSKTVTITDEIQKLKFNVYKVDEDDNEVKLSGAEFTIYANEDYYVGEKLVYSNGDEVIKITTNKDGEATAQLYVNCEYKIVETKAPEGYINSGFSEIFKADFNPDIEYQVIDKTVVNIPTEVTITKSDFSTGALIPDCGIEILDENGEVVRQGRTDDDGEVIFKRLSEGKYFYREFDAPAGYIIDETAYPFEITEEGIVRAEMTNKMTEVHITKSDFSTGELIPDCGVEIIDENGEVIRQGRTDENGEVVFEGIPKGKYFYREFDAPKGYVIDETAYPFEITEEGIVRAEMTNKKITGKLVIIKTNEKGEALSGVEFEILDDNGNVVATGVTNKDGKFECQLTYGKYKYHEVKTLDGYEKDDTYYEFEITENGQVIEATVVNKTTGTGKPTPPTTPPTTTVDQGNPPTITTNPSTRVGNGLDGLAVVIAVSLVFVMSRKLKKE